MRAFTRATLCQRRLLTNSIFKTLKTDYSPKAHQKKPRYEHEHKRFGKYASPKMRHVQLRLDSGTEKAKSAIEDIVATVKTLNSSHTVMFIDGTGSKPKRSNLIDVANALDLSEHGLRLTNSNDTGLPIVRRIKAQEMIQQYSDKLAELMEQRLLQRGSVAAQKAVASRLQAERKKSAPKIIAISWLINLGDLNKQKRSEIEKRAQKGERFFIYLGEKKTLVAARKVIEQGGEEIAKSDLTEIETRKRELIRENIEQILTEIECKFEVSGNYDLRLTLSCVPKPVTIPKETDPSPKELKRHKKLAKQTKKETVETKEEDLDALYLFKIE